MAPTPGCKGLGKQEHNREDGIPTPWAGLPILHVPVMASERLEAAESFRRREKLTGNQDREPSWPAIYCAKGASGCLAKGLHANKQIATDRLAVMKQHVHRGLFDDAQQLRIKIQRS